MAGSELDAAEELINERQHSLDCWANVEVMGHRRFAGRVSEQIVAGCGFVRVDVPQVDDRMAFTKLIGTSSIYAITPVSEAVARALARQYRENPVEIYTPSVQRMLGDDREDF